MLQQGQVFRLNSGTGETSCWAYRYRVGGRGSRCVQRGGFRSERDTSEALERVRKQRSPLTDSNRRPPPYDRGGRAASRAVSASHIGQGRPAENLPSVSDERGHGYAQCRWQVS